jgi:hypothetical protein
MAWAWEAENKRPLSNGFIQRGTEQTYTLRRLARDNPELLDRVTDQRSEARTPLRYFNCIFFAEVQKYSIIFCMEKNMKATLSDDQIERAAVDALTMLGIELPEGKMTDDQYARVIDELVRAVGVCHALSVDALQRARYAYGYQIHALRKIHTLVKAGRYDALPREVLDALDYVRLLAGVRVSGDSEGGRG